MRNFLVCLLFICSLTNVQAATGETLTIQSDYAEVFHDRQEAIFYHNVVAKNAEMNVQSDRMRVRYTPSEDQKNKSSSGPNINQRIDTVEFFDRVFMRMLETGEKIYSDYAIFDNAKQQLEAHGNLKIVRKEGTLLGERYIYDVKKRQSKIYGGTDNAGAKKSSDKPLDDRITIIIEKNSLPLKQK